MLFQILVCCRICILSVTMTEALACVKCAPDAFYCSSRRRKTLISNRGRWSPLSLFRQVHLGVGKFENNPPFSGLRAASTWEAVGFCGSHRQTDVLAKLSSWLGG